MTADDTAHSKVQQHTLRPWRQLPAPPLSFAPVKDRIKASSTDVGMNIVFDGLRLISPSISICFSLYGFQILDDPVAQAFKPVLGIILGRFD